MMHVQSICFAHRTDCFLTLLSLWSLKVLNRDFKIQRRGRQEEHRLESEFAFFESL